LIDHRQGFLKVKSEVLSLVIAQTVGEIFEENFGALSEKTFLITFSVMKKSNWGLFRLLV